MECNRRLCIIVLLTGWGEQTETPPVYNFPWPQYQTTPSHSCQTLWTFTAAPGFGRNAETENRNRVVR